MPDEQVNLAELYADIPIPGTGLTEEAIDLLQRIQANARIDGEPQATRLMASTRGDLGGTSLQLLRHAASYQQRVMRVWEAYHTDPFFQRLVNRTIEFACNGSHWEVGAGVVKGSWIEHIKKWVNGKLSGLAREEDVWKTWWETVNTGAPNTLPGGDQVVRWAAKHMLLSGMFIPHWEWRNMRYGKQDFLFPMAFTCYPASSVTLSRKNSLFMEEELYLLRPQQSQMMEGNPLEAPQMTIGGSTQNQLLLPTTRFEGRPGLGKTEAYALKYNWSPGDLSTMRIGQYGMTGTGVYPMVPFFSLMSQFTLRQKLFASDIALADGLINYMLVWQIGDEKFPAYPPKRDSNGNITEKGMIGWIRSLTEGVNGPGQSVWIPHYVKPFVLQPDVKALLDGNKYDASVLEIYQAFGIFFTRSTSGSRERMERINVTNFEEMLATLRMHIAAFLHSLATHIVKANPGKLETRPNWTPHPINTRSEIQQKLMLEFGKTGRVSTRTLQQLLGLDPNVENPRIAGELGGDADDMYDAAVPTQFKQTTVQPDLGTKPPTGAEPAEETVNTVTPGFQRGRPPGGGVTE